MPETRSNDALVDDSPPRRRRRLWPWVLGIVLLLIAALVIAGFVAVKFFDQAMDVRADLLAAKSRLSGLPQLVRDGDTATFESVSTEVVGYTARADATVQGPLWSIAANVPFVGQNVAAVRGAAEATHILVRDALPASFGVLNVMNFDKIRLEGGGFDLAPFREAVTTLPTINAAFAAAEEKVAGIDRDSLLPFVDDAVGELVTVIDDAAPMLRTVEDVLPSALQIAGDGGPRSYLVIFQNNAEIRATGGNPAASVLMRVDQGRMYLDMQASSTTFGEQGTDDAIFLALPPETSALYADDFARFSQNFSRTPNFPTTAQLFTSLWAATTGIQPDGVISIDPVVLSHILEVTGPVTAADGTEITAENAVRVLLKETYERFPAESAPADAFFANVSATVFGKVIGSGWDPMAMIGQLQRAVGEERVYAWFAREDEEAMAHRLGIDGVMTGDNSETTQVGIFLNDSGVSKMQYYLNTSVDVACDPAARTVSTTITMTNTVPAGAQLSYYTHTLRAGTYGQPDDAMIMDVLFFAPPGGTILGSQPATGDIPEWSRTSTENGRNAGSITVFLGQGETRSVTYTSSVPEGELGPISARYSPTVTDTPVTIAASCAELTGP
ncbi:DUF4012 domain-containing protein [uncultured Microbacterium sp.]|uniref:DUF4012 domain-containing protein n=1 Tax=uncultured Microbacterium sp. TaxID=191216 RepID=UPI0028D05DAB|nr:DUF4012 domain-containing protein [uncultured Microbacterium sp.]